jgi:hypothetical protein
MNIPDKWRRGRFSATFALAEPGRPDQKISTTKNTKVTKGFVLP